MLEACAIDWEAKGYRDGPISSSPDTIRSYSSKVASGMVIHVHCIDCPRPDQTSGKTRSARIESAMSATVGD